MRHHGEHGAIVRLMTHRNGLVAGYVQGGRSRAIRPILSPGNLVQAEFRVRTAGQLAGLTVELLHSRAPMLTEPLPAAAIDWICALTAVALPEENAYPALYQALEGVLAAVEAAPAARGWAAGLVRFELLLLSELGFGLELSGCTVSGANDDLAYVSPKSAAAVSRSSAIGYEARLLPLPSFLIHGGSAEWDALFEGFRLTGHFIERNILNDRRSDVLAARERLLERLKRAVA